MMDSGEINRQRISALADGELGPAETGAELERAQDAEWRATWDLYHRIGDVVRSEAMARDLSSGFSARMAERLAAEPSLLAPRRRLLSRLGAWPVTLAAIAATGFGFFVAPTLFNGHDAGRAAQPAAAAVSLPTSHGTLLADASGSRALSREPADYIRLHQSSNPALYGIAPGGGTPSVANSMSER